MNTATSQTKPVPDVKLPILGQFVSRVDGSFVLRPSRTKWITVSEATQLPGRISRKSVYRLVEDYLVCRRPVPRRVPTGDTEFWSDPERQRQLREIVKEEMTRQTIAALDLKPEKPG